MLARTSTDNAMPLSLGSRTPNVGDPGKTSSLRSEACVIRFEPFSFWPYAIRRFARAGQNQAVDPYPAVRREGCSNGYIPSRASRLFWVASDDRPHTRAQPKRADRPVPFLR